jgi:hypothetical protein
MTETRIRTLRRRARYCSFGACFVVTGTVLALVMIQATAGAAGSPVSLGTASTFGVLAGSTVTNTGLTVINGDLGLSPGSSVTGFPPGSVTGTQYIGDAVAATAQSDLTTAYNAAAAQATTHTIVSGRIVGATTLGPGVYTVPSSLLVGGTLTLDGGDNPDASFIFQIPSALTTASGTTIVLTGDASACNVFWQVGSSATIGTGTTFQGSILALTSITVQTGDTIFGAALARNAAVTLDDDDITVPDCSSQTSSSASASASSSVSASPSNSVSASPSNSVSASPSNSVSSSPSFSPTFTPSSGPFPTPSPTPTFTLSSSPSPTATSPPSTSPPISPSPSPGHHHKHRKPAPRPTPVPVPFPVTG